MRPYLVSFLSLALCLVLFQQCSEVEFSSEQYSENSSNEVQEVLRSLEPVLAIRGSGCITCHAKVNSSFITDFGYGSSFYLGAQQPKFSFGSGSFYGDHGNSWSSSLISGKVIVPKTAPSNILGQSTTLAEYIKGEEFKKAADARAEVVEKNQIYIGAPDNQTLFTRFSANDQISIKFVRNSNQSPFLTGIQKEKEGYYSNTSELTCDGDVLINGTLLLNNPVIKTHRGCRIYATKTIFFQGELKFQDISAQQEQKMNLQLVSSRAIMMGVGKTHCESSQYPGSYSATPNVYGSDPMKFRFQGIWTAAGMITRSSLPLNRDGKAEGDLIMSDAEGFADRIQDASCFPNRRETHLEHLLVNAPQIHSRYRGKFKGIMIAELALASLNAFTFDFDPVFSQVPVLPLLKEEDFLQIK